MSLRYPIIEIVAIDREELASSVTGWWDARPRALRTSTRTILSPIIYLGSAMAQPSLNCSPSRNTTNSRRGTDENWRDFLKKWLSDAHHVSILGKPSKARIAKEKEELGEEGLQKVTRSGKARSLGVLANDSPMVMVWSWSRVPSAITSTGLARSETARAWRLSSGYTLSCLTLCLTLFASRRPL